MTMTPFERGFVKAAVEAGFSEKQAKASLDNAGETSFLGRYMADNAMDRATQFNKELMLNKMDPTGKRFSSRVLLSGPELTEQRGHAAKLVPATLNREAERNFFLDTGLTGLLGALAGGIFSQHPRFGGDPANLGMGIGIGAAGGAGLGALANLWAKYRRKKITKEDIRKTLERKKDNSLLKELTPFSGMYDAATPRS